MIDVNQVTGSLDFDFVEAAVAAYNRKAHNPQPNVGDRHTGPRLEIKALHASQAILLTAPTITGWI
jgi:hypothetical protein